MAQNNNLDRTIMPKVGDHFLLKLTEPEHIKLDNNIDAYIINQSSEEFVRMDIVLNAGSSLQSKALVASSTLSSIIDGTKSSSSAQIAQKIDYHGAYVDTYITKDKASVTLYCLSKHLQSLLPLVNDLVCNASFPELELQNYLHRKKHQFILNNDKVKYKASLEFNKLIFGENSAYGRVIELDDYDKLFREDLVDFYNLHYVPQNMYIIISGNVSKNTIAIVNKYLGNNKISKTTLAAPDIIVSANLAVKNKFVKKEDAMQSALRIGHPIINKLHPDYNSLVVLNTILGGYFGSRLMSNLRENKGYTYGIGSYIINFLHGGYFSIATEVNAIHTNAAINEIKIEMDKLRTRLVSSDELELVKNYIYGTYLRSFDGSMALAERYRSAKDLNLNFEYFSDSLSSMMKQTPKQLLETANKYFIFDDMIKLVVGSLDN